MKDINTEKTVRGRSRERLQEIHREEWCGQCAVVLENANIIVTVLPELGGKLASVCFRRTGLPDFELAAQPRRFRYRVPETDTMFSSCDASGIDDAFPTIDPGTLPGENSRFSYTDHGEIWRSRFSSEICGDSLVLGYESRDNPFFYQKEVTLLEQGVRLHWKIRNSGNVSFPFIWTMHGLVRYEEDMELLYPDEIRCFLNVLDSPELGAAGTEHLTGADWDFHRVPDKNSASQMKYYAAGKVKAGWCGYYYPRSKVRCMLYYDAESLPWLGMWITAGGFRGDYNCAWEPSSGFYDGVERALKTNTLRVLHPGDEFSFQAEYRLES